MSHQELAGSPLRGAIGGMLACWLLAAGSAFSAFQITGNSYFLTTNQIVIKRGKNITSFQLKTIKNNFLLLLID